MKWLGVSVLMGLAACGAIVEGRTWSLCELGHGASRAGKGVLTQPQANLVAGETRGFIMQDPIVGPEGPLSFKVGQSVSLAGFDGGALFLVAMNTAVGLNDLAGQGLFWEYAPGVFRNSAMYNGALTEDGGTVGGVSEAELRSELARGASLAQLSECFAHTNIDGGVP